MHTALKSHHVFSHMPSSHLDEERAYDQSVDATYPGFLSLIEGNYQQQESRPDAHPDWDQLLQGLQQELEQDDQLDCAFTLLLPASGEVDIRMSRYGNKGVYISMRVPHRTWAVWSDKQWACQQQLSEALQCPIKLQLEQELDDGSIE